MTVVGVPTPVPDESRPDDRPADDRDHLPRWGRRVAVMAGVLVAMVLVSKFLPLPTSPTEPDAQAILDPPSGDHWFGTDQTGLDVFSRTVRAAHLDLLVATGSIAIAMAIGTVLGILASRPGRWSSLFMRGVDTFQAFPGLILVVAILSLLDGGTLTILCVISLMSIAPFVRVVRAAAVVVRQSEYVEFATVIGVPRRAIMVRHVLRNVTGAILAQASVGAAGAVATLAAVSFLGFGVAPPTPTWGTMIKGGAADIVSGAWWTVLFPGIALTTAIVLLNRIADDVESWLARDVA